MEDDQVKELLELARPMGREACITLDLPISDEAFQLIDDIEDSLKYWLKDDLDISDGRFASEMGDWPSGSGVISCYTSEQVQLWADLGAWQADLDDYRGDDVASATDIIGRELSGIAYTIADAMAVAVERALDVMVAS